MSIQLAAATAFTDWLVDTATQAAADETRAAYQARVAKAEPLRVVVTRHQCPHCRTTRAHRSDAAAHIARCWQNPDAHGCKTCANFDQAPSGDDCFPGRPCNCNEGWERCTAGLSIDNGLVIDCPRWAPHADA